jgi:hypothetical protein
MEVCVGGVCEASALVFVSSTRSDAALGGPRGADETCAELAEAAGLGGYWFSWTSDPCTSPFKRFEKSTLPYRMVDGSEISPSWDRMTMNPPPAGMGYIGTPIDMDEYGDIPATSQQCASSSNPPQGCFVWTPHNRQQRVRALDGRQDHECESRLDGRSLLELRDRQPAALLLRTVCAGPDSVSSFGPRVAEY